MTAAESRIRQIHWFMLWSSWITGWTPDGRDKERHVERLDQSQKFNGRGGMWGSFGAVANETSRSII